jgi:hypothetical protein
MRHMRTLHVSLFVLALFAGTAFGVELPTQVWVDHSWTGPGSCGGHTWGVDAFKTVSLGVGHVAEGGFVYVAGGTYTEQVAVGTDGIQIIGLGSPGDPTTIVCPQSFTHRFFSGPIENWAVLTVEDARGVSILNITVDGAGVGHGIGRFVGIAFWNADGIVSDCRITRIKNVPATEEYSGVGIYAGNTSRGPYELSLLQTTIDDYQSNGMLLTGRGLSLVITGCVAQGRGAMTEMGQTGIQILDGPYGRITDCHVGGHDYIGHDGLVGTGFWIENAGGPVELSYGCTATNNQVGVLFRNSDGAIREAIMSNTEDCRSGIVIHNSRVLASMAGGMRLMGEGGPEGGREVEMRPMKVEVAGCDVGGHGVTGIEIATDGGRIAASLTGNKIHNWVTGVIAEGAERTVVQAYGNRFYENTLAHAVDNTVSPPSIWNIVAGGGPGNYWEDYSGTGAYQVDGTAGAIDFSPNPSTSFNIASSTALVNCNGRATLTVSINPVACMRGYDLLLEFDPTRWINPTFTKLLSLGSLGEVEDQFTAYALTGGKWRISHTIVGHTSGFASSTPVDVFQVDLTPKSGVPQGSSSFALGTRYSSVDFPTVYDTFDGEIASTVATTRIGVSVDCTAPTVGGVTAYGDVRDGSVPAVIINGQETPANGGHVTKLWYQFQTQGHACSNASVNWKELAAVSLSSGSWTSGQAYRATTVPDFIGPCTMYVMAEDEAGNKGSCAGAAGVNFVYDPIESHDGDGRGAGTGGTPPRHCELAEAMPNPFGSRTVIPFALSAPVDVRLVIYDVSGRLVRTLSDGFMPAGYHSADWDGTDDFARPLARGIYFYRLDAGSFHSHKRVLLLK